MVIDWGNVTFNHYIPSDLLSAENISPAELEERIEAMRPAAAEPIEVPAALIALVKPEPVIAPEIRLCALIDAAADMARAKVAGDPLRAVEYDRARVEAEAFAAAAFQGEPPRTVAAWAINGRTPRQAAESILAEAAAYTEALYVLRETRLQAKELIRIALAAGNTEQAEDIAAETVAAIEASVAGIGNNTGA